MTCHPENKDFAWSLRIPFTTEEAKRFRNYLEANDKKAGRFVRTLVLAALEREEGRGDGLRDLARRESEGGGLGQAREVQG